MKKLIYYLIILTIGGFISFFAFWYTLAVHVKGKVVTTPLVVGKSIEEAKSLLQKDGLLLKINTKREVYSDYIEKGKIAIQIPQAKKIIKKGRDIEVILSKGSKRDVVPYVVGKTIEEASKIINLHGFKISSVSSIYSDAEDGTIVAQSPEGGKSGIFNDKVKLLVSIGKTPEVYKMPDLRFMPLLEAEAVLKKKGLNYIVKTFANQIRDKHILFVKEQYPRPGYKVQSNQTIILKVVMRESL